VIQIVGAGFSGLMTAYYLVKAGHKVRILEKSGFSGGLIQTLRNELGLVETAANGFLNCDELQSISRDIGVPLISTRKESRNRYIFMSSPRRWPLKATQTLLAAPGLLRFGFFRDKSLRPQANETLENYGKRVFGEAVTYRMLEPALRGIYAGQIQEISASLIFSKYFDPKRPRMRSTVAPEKGMSAFIRGLEAWLRIRGVDIQYGRAVESRQLQHGLWVIATPAYAASELLNVVAPEAAEKLRQVEMLPIVTATLFFEEKESLRGFGVLFPETEKFNSLGVLFNHDIFYGRSVKQSETWILGGANNKSINEKSNEEILDVILKDRRRVFKNENKPIQHVITRWPQALPHYSVRLEKILSELETPLNVHLVGNYLGQIGLSQMIFQAKAEASRWS